LERRFCFLFVDLCSERPLSFLQLRLEMSINHTSAPINNKMLSKSLSVRAGGKVASMLQDPTWEKAYSELEHSVSEKEKEIVMVAELGKSLLDSKEKADQQIQELTDRDNEKNMMIEKLQETIAHLESQLSDDSDSPNDGKGSNPFNSPLRKAKHIQEEQATKIEFLEEECSRLQLKCTQLDSIVTHVQNEQQFHEETWKKKEKQLQSEISDFKKQHQEANDELEACKLNLEKLRNEHLQLKRTNNRLETDKKEAEELLLEAESKMSQFVTDFSDLQTKYKRKEMELQEAKDQLEEFLEHSANETPSLALLQQSLSHLIKENHHLQQEKEDLINQLKTAHEKIQKLSNDEEDLLLGSRLNTERMSMVGVSSLLSELEESIKSKDNIGMNQTESLTSLTTEKPGNKSGRKLEEVSEHEYFFLTAASVKISLVLKSPEKTKEILQVDLPELYRKAQEEHIPFHDWHSWITVQFGNKMYSSNESSTVSSQSPTKTNSSSKPNQHNSTDISTDVNRSAAKSNPRKSLLQQDPLLVKGSAEDGLFNELEKKSKDLMYESTKRIITMEDISMEWLQLQNRSTMEPVKSSSPHPKENLHLHKLFGIENSEFLIEFYSCTLDEIAGILYITQLGIYFYALRNTPMITKGIGVRLAFQEIESIWKPFKFNPFASNAIFIKTRKEVKFTFAGFQHFEHAYENLRKLWRTAAMADEDRKIETTKQRLQSFQRQLSFRISNSGTITSDSN